jgi:hypothetical protein
MTRTHALIALTLLALTALPAAADEDAPEIEPIKIEVTYTRFYDYQIPAVVRPSVDPETQHKKIKTNVMLYQAYAAEGKERNERSALLGAMERYESKLTPEAWLLLGDLRLLQARDDQEAMLMVADADSNEMPELYLPPVLEAYRTAAEKGDDTIGAWAHYAIALAYDDDRAVEPLEAVANSSAVPSLATDAWLRLGARYTDADESERALRSALDRGEGERKARAAIELAKRAFMRADYSEALALAAQSLDGATFDGDDDRGTRLCVESLAYLGDNTGAALPGDLDTTVAADILVALGEYWLHGNVGQHPAEALAAYEAAQAGSPSSRAAKKCQAGLTEAQALLETPTETSRQWVERVSRLCIDRAMAHDASMNCAADIHLTPGSPPTLAAEVREASGKGKAALDACLEGPLPAPMGDASWPEEELMVLFDNY